MQVLNIFSTIIALLATIPILTFLIVFLILKKVSNEATKSTKLAADVSAIFFIFAVDALLYIIFERGFFAWIVISYMLIVVFVLMFQWRKEIEINVWRAVRMSWRIGFIIMCAAYIILLPFGIIANY
ncbi:DUF3397 domain-containing protein [Bacillaceae bacterium W0354]